MHMRLQQQPNVFALAHAGCEGQPNNGLLRFLIHDRTHVLRAFTKRVAASGAGKFVIHQAAFLNRSGGYKSGRISQHGTSVASDNLITHREGIWHHCETACDDIPPQIRPAFAGPPAASIISFILMVADGKPPLHNSQARLTLQRKHSLR